MSKHKNFTSGYAEMMRVTALCVGGGTLVGALVSERRLVGALSGAALGIVATFAYAGLKPKPKMQRDKV